jgi:hypothetical protein
MKYKCALIIHAHGLSVWQQHSHSHSVPVLTLDLADAGTQTRWQNWLAGARRRCILIADVADERHLVERLPRTSRADRHLLIQRRIAQHFPDTPLTSAAPLPASPEDGALAPFRLAALTRPALITPWLDTLAGAASRGQLAVQCLTSVPFLLEHWYRRQRTLPAQALLLTLGAGGMRQIFFRQRRLAFSRLIPARADTLSGNLPAYRDELTQTLAWLAAQRLSDGVPPVSVLATASELQTLRELSAVTGGHIECLDLAPAPDILTLVLQEAQRGGATELLHGSTPGQYNCPTLQGPQRLATARRSLVALSVALTATSLTAAALDLTEASRVQHATAQLATRSQTLQSEISRLNTNTPSVPDTNDLAHWLDSAEHLTRNPGIAPAEVLQAVADFLAESPWARLTALTWEPAQNGHEHDRALPPDTASNTPSAANTVIQLAIEVDLDDKAPPPQSAASTLGIRWQQQHGTPMQAHISNNSDADADASPPHLQLSATFSLSPAPQKPQDRP